eukprot:3878395-Prymnesium_polylepis.1
MVPWHSETLRRCNPQRPRLSGVISSSPPATVRLHRAQLTSDTSRRRKSISCCDRVSAPTLSCSPSAYVDVCGARTDMCAFVRRDCPARRDHREEPSPKRTAFRERKARGTRGNFTTPWAHLPTSGFKVSRLPPRKGERAP